MLYHSTLFAGSSVKLSSCSQLLGQWDEGAGLVIPGSGYARINGVMAYGPNGSRMEVQ